MRDLFIIGMARDAHCVRVAQRLVDQGGKAYLFDPTVACPFTYDFAQPQAPAMAIGLSGEAIYSRPAPVDLANIVAWRRLKLSFDFFESREKQELYYYSNEALSFINAAFYHAGIIQFNAPDASRTASNKILQLSAAANAGMVIPKTRYTNEPSVVSALAATVPARRLIGKALKTAYIPPTIGNGDDSRLIHTTPISASDLSDPWDAYEAVAIYQERIEKAFELRIIAFGDEHHAFSVHTPCTEDGALDWRLTQYENTHQYLGQIDELQPSLEKYLSSFGLEYGVFDFVKTPAGDYVFLECNPDGQWGWLEEETGQPVVTDMFARHVLRLMGDADGDLSDPGRPASSTADARA